MQKEKITLETHELKYIMSKLLSQELINEFVRFHKIKEILRMK